MNSTQDYMHNFAIKKQEIMELVNELANKQTNTDKLPKVRQEILDEVSSILVFIQRLEILSIKKKQVDQGHEPRVLELTSIIDVLIPAIKFVVDGKASISLVKQTRLRLLRSLRRHESFFLILRRSIFNSFIDIYYLDSVPTKVIIGLCFPFSMAGMIALISSVYFLNYGTQTSELSQVSQSLEKISNERREIEQALARMEEPKRVLSSLTGESRQLSLEERISQIESTLTSLDNQVKAQLQVMEEQNQADKELTITLPFGLETISLSPEDSQIIFRVFVVGASGALGSVVSILIRLKEFDVEFREILDPVIPFLIGAFKPIIGASFGVFLYTLISSGLVPLDTNPTNATGRKEDLFYFAIAFTVGFSERLAKDVIARAETTVKLVNVRDVDESGEQ
ncbi:MAG: hypothetical protein RIM23_29310 [Coleofasciculus sp. G3-WIS-01]|uniref:hypothetical protein n=1 Tax=Coleofasciculus sp. G3-WIS-01 TaxID=3069528 RepID=UPI0032F0F268